MKLRLLAILILLGLPAAAFAQLPFIPVVQTGAGHGDGTTCVFPQNVTSGNITIVAESWYNSTSTPAVSDTRSTSYSQVLIDTSNTTGNVGIAAYIGTFSSSGSNTVTFSVSGSSYNNISCVEILPLYSATVDASAVSAFTGTPGTVTSSSITTTANNDFIYGYIGGFRDGGSFKPDSDSTMIGHESGHDCEGAEFKLAGANGSYTESFSNTTNDVGRILIIALKPSSITIQSPSVLPTGGLTAAYNYTMLATGGAGSYTWSITSGALQSGLSLNSSTGAITGTPTASSNSSITFQVTDGTNTTTKAVTLKVVTSLNSVSVLQTKAGTGSTSLAYTSNVTSGSVLAVASGFTNDFANGEYCTDSLGTNFQLVVFNNFYKAAFAGIHVFVGKATSGGADTVTCGLNIGSMVELSNAQIFGNDNVLTTSNNTGSPITSGSLTTLVPNEFLLGVGAGYTNASTLTVSSPFTSIAGSINQASGYEIATTVTGYTVSFTMSANTDGHWQIVLLGIRPDGGSVAAAVGVRHRVVQF